MAGSAASHSADPAAAGSAAAAPSPWKPGDVVMDRYRIIDVMSGSMGHVYICEHLGWGVKMAMKSPRPEVMRDAAGMRMILAEAEAWTGLGMHPNIACCYYVLTLDEIPRIFIEYVDGGNLAEWIKAGRCRDLRTAINLAVQFCHGMEYTHANGIIHRDIKPQNILLTRSALLKITDFGIILRKEMRTGGQGFRGTPAYASPEQFRSATDLGPASDIFSFGICLWLMLCGRRPFKRNDIEQEIPAPSPQDGGNFPHDLENLLRETVAFAPEMRPESFAAIRHRLDRIHQELFGVPCPYTELPGVDLRADSLNNQAVSLHELGQTGEAMKYLDRALALNDSLPEAIYNLILLEWKNGGDASRLLRRAEAAAKRLDAGDTFAELLNGLALAARDDAPPEDGDRKDALELKLCHSPGSVDVFREAQLENSVRRNIENHMKNGRAKACHDVLMTAWRKTSFRRDHAFAKVYAWLLDQGQTDAASGCLRLATFSSGSHPVTGLCRIPGTGKVIAGTMDGRVFMRSVSGGRTREFPMDRVNGAVCVAAAGDRIAIGRQDGAVILLNRRSGRKNSPYRHKAAVRTVCLSPDGKILASGDDNGVVKTADIHSGKVTVRSQADSAVTGIVFRNHGRDMASCGEDGRIYLWEGDSGECIKIVDAHTLPAVGLSSDPGGRLIVSAGSEGMLKLWDSASGRLLREMDAGDERLSAVLFLPCGRHAVSGSSDDIIRIWDVKTGECRLLIDGRGDGVNTLAQGRGPGMFLAGFADGSITVFMVVYSLKF